MSLRGVVTDRREEAGPNQMKETEGEATKERRARMLRRPGRPVHGWRLAADGKKISTNTEKMKKEGLNENSAGAMQIFLRPGEQVK